MWTKFILKLSVPFLLVACMGKVETSQKEPKKEQQVYESVDTVLNAPEKGRLQYEEIGDYFIVDDSRPASREIPEESEIDTTWNEIGQIQSGTGAMEMKHNPDTSAVDVDECSDKLSVKAEDKKSGETVEPYVLPQSEVGDDQEKLARYIALKTNLPFLLIGLWNLAAEIQLNKHISIDFPVYWNLRGFDSKKSVRGIALQPECRWWFKEVGRGHFGGFHVHAAWFNLKWNAKRYQTRGCPLLGGGISYGYRLPFAKHWGADFELGVGYARMRYDTFANVENGRELGLKSCDYLGVTRLELALNYQF